LLGRAIGSILSRNGPSDKPGTIQARAQRDDELRVAIQRVWDDHQQVYGPRKVWRQLRREHDDVARCTIERLMCGMGLRGAVRGRAWKITTASDPAATRPADLVERRFTATRPHQLWVADFTDVAAWRGFVYVAFVIDVFARRIVGWRVSASLATDFVLDALEQAIYGSRCGSGRRPAKRSGLLAATAFPRTGRGCRGSPAGLPCLSRHSSICPRRLNADLRRFGSSVTIRNRRVRQRLNGGQLTQRS
jgi:transposase InsO family protein